MTKTPYQPYTEDLSAIVDQLAPLFAPDGLADLTDDQKAFEDLKRLAGLQTSRLHSGQAIMRQIDSMINSWRRTAKFGGASTVMAAQYIDCLQQVRVAIFGEPLGNDEATDGGASEIVTLDLEEAFKKFVSDQQISEEEIPGARKGFEAAFGGERVSYPKPGIAEINGVFYVKMTDDQKKKYSFR